MRTQTALFDGHEHDTLVHLLQRQTDPDRAVVRASSDALLTAAKTLAPLACLEEVSPMLLSAESGPVQLATVKLVGTLAARCTAEQLAAVLPSLLPGLKRVRGASASVRACTTRITNGSSRADRSVYTWHPPCRLSRIPQRKSASLPSSAWSRCTACSASG